MSRRREYRVDPMTGTMVPAWGENEEWGAVRSEHVGGSMVVGRPGSRVVLGAKDAAAQLQSKRRRT